MSYAIVAAGGSQHRVETGARLTLNHQAGEVGAELVFGEVLLLATGSAAQIGRPHVAGARVVGKILAHGRGPKVRVFKRRKRKGFHKTIGHRQAFTEVEIVRIGG